MASSRLAEQPEELKIKVTPTTPLAVQSSPNTASARLPGPSKRRWPFLVLNLVVLFVVLRETYIFNYVEGGGTSLLKLVAPPRTNHSKCVELNKNHLEPGYFNEDMCLTREDMLDIIMQVTYVTAQVFTEHNITYWLESGTLLGAFRHHNIIPHDTDADLGIDEASYLRLRDKPFQAFFPEHYKLTVYNSTVNDDGGRGSDLPVRIIDTRNGFYVDVFVFLESIDKDGRVMIGPEPSGIFNACEYCPFNENNDAHFILPKDWVFPLQQCTFGSKRLKCPHEPILYLEFYYGPNFMTPKDWSVPN